MTDAKYFKCPICKQRREWTTYNSGLMLITWDDDSPFVCNECKEEGERRNWAIIQYVDAYCAPIFELARKQWPSMVTSPAIYRVSPEESAFEVQVNHLDTGSTEIDRVAPVQLGAYRMAYSPSSYSLGVWGWEGVPPPENLL